MEQKVTIPEQRFLVYYREVNKKQINWTYRSAMYALGYSSPRSIGRIVDGLRKKGYKIESKRSTLLKPHRDITAKLPKDEKNRLSMAVKNIHNI